MTSNDDETEEEERGRNEAEKGNQEGRRKRL